MATVLQPWLLPKAIALLVPELPGEDIGVFLTPEHVQIVRVLQESHEGAALVEISDKSHTIIAALSVEATADLRAGVGGQDGFVRLKQGGLMPVITLMQYHFVAVAESAAVAAAPAADGQQQAEQQQQQQQQQQRVQRLELRVSRLDLVSSTQWSMLGDPAPLDHHVTVRTMLRGTSLRTDGDGSSANEPGSGGEGGNDGNSTGGYAVRLPAMAWRTVSCHNVSFAGRRLARPLPRRATRYGAPCDPPARLW